MLMLKCTYTFSGHILSNIIWHSENLSIGKPWSNLYKCLHEQFTNALSFAHWDLISILCFSIAKWIITGKAINKFLEGWWVSSYKSRAFPLMALNDNFKIISQFFSNFINLVHIIWLHVQYIFFTSPEMKHFSDIL